MKEPGGYDPIGWVDSLLEDSNRAKEMEDPTPMSYSSDGDVYSYDNPEARKHLQAFFRPADWAAIRDVYASGGTLPTERIQQIYKGIPTEGDDFVAWMLQAMNKYGATPSTTRNR